MSILDSFDVDQDELELIDRAVRQPPQRNDKRICICGHPVSRHNEVTKACRPARFSCPCKRLHPVIEVPDTRYFLSRTLGSGEKHALTRGIFMARNAMGDDFEARAKWLVDMVCENPECRKPTKLFPIKCDTDWFRIYDSEKEQGVTCFYCESCRNIYYDSEEAIQAKREAMRLRNTTQTS
jgi:hypothetical protein